MQRKILSESNRLTRIFNQKNKIQKEIEKGTLTLQNDIKKFKNESLEKDKFISEEIVSDIIKDIFGEDLNKSSIKATVSEVVKEQRIKIKYEYRCYFLGCYFVFIFYWFAFILKCPKKYLIL